LFAADFPRQAAFRHDLVAGIGERELGPHQHAAAAQQVGHVLGGGGEAQQHRTVRGIDRHAARQGHVPLPAVDGRGLVLRNFENVVATLRQGVRGGTESGAGQQQAAPGNRERHFSQPCYADIEEETR
jgi:hypothetical protein